MSVLVERQAIQQEFWSSIYLSHYIKSDEFVNTIVICLDDAFSSVLVQFCY